MSPSLFATQNYDTLPLPWVLAWSFVISALNFTIVSFASFTLSFRSLISYRILFLAFSIFCSVLSFFSSTETSKKAIRIQISFERYESEIPTTVQ